jgi:N-acetyl-anhydromuramyl-L-alanine amidase AmpD
LILIHATRGPTTPQLQYRATINWFAFPSLTEKAKRKLRGWGPMADFCVGYNGELAQFGDYQTTRPNWSAGYGAKGVATWPADAHAISIEVAQSDKLEPYSEASLKTLTWLCQRLMDEYNIPADFFLDVNQRMDQPIPRGFTGHENLANGERLGKTDPGVKFPWIPFMDWLDPAQTPKQDDHKHGLEIAPHILTTKPL